MGILFVAINLRPALSSIGPLIDFIRQDIGISETLLGLLTTLPLIAFGVVSTITPLFTKRFGIGNTLTGALILLTSGVLIRSLGGIFPIYFGTILLGIAIAFGNVLIPALIKRNRSSTFSEVFFALVKSKLNEALKDSPGNMHYPHFPQQALLRTLVYSDGQCNKRSY